jgi:hypothetical protein
MIKRMMMNALFNALKHGSIYVGGGLKVAQKMSICLIVITVLGLPHDIA